jgi:cellulose synthase/poly-beta-1,6-N-acetylglucosamine synthase-like glycosyltransferase
MIIKIIFWISVLLIFHTYLIYPVMMFIIDLTSRKEIIKKQIRNFEPSISVLMAVHNEEKVIREKIRLLFDSDYPQEKIEVLVGSDASDDLTEEILTGLVASEQRLRLICFRERTGKPAIINSLSAMAKGEILILTDANVFPEKKTIRNLVNCFADEKTGLVDSRLINTGIKKDGISIPEKAYLSIESKVKHAEGRLWGTMMGPFGGFYAVRKKSFEPLSGNTLADDFRICMNVIEKKEKAISNPEAVVYEDVSNNLLEEFSRKVRISTGNFQNLRHFSYLLLNPFSKWSFCFISHKVLRWVTPFLFIIAFVMNILLINESFFFMTLAILQVIFIFLPALDFIIKKLNINIVPLRFLTHFFFMNVALFIGFFRNLNGVNSGVWKPTKRYQ